MKIRKGCALLVLCIGEVKKGKLEGNQTKKRSEAREEEKGRKELIIQNYVPFRHAPLKCTTVLAGHNEL